MCGICGTAGFSDRDLLVRMCATLRHRGPDGWGVFCDEGVGLGSTRLAIIDLLTGNQPMTNEDRSVWVVFDGEIYNYLELKRILLSKGHIFRTTSDTETIVHLYEEMGEECIKRLEGMFALAVWDCRRRLLLLARDRIGIKPLHYAVAGERLLFGSEIKALLESDLVDIELDERALHDYLSYLHIPAPRTMIKGVRKLLPGQFLTYSRGSVDIKWYWKPEPRRIEDVAEEQHCEAIRHYMEDAVRRELQSDVPVGILLSGGTDSSAVTALAATHSSEPLKTFTVGLEGEEDQVCDERAFARQVAGMYGTEHRELVVNPDVVSLLPRMVRHFDEPFGNSTAIAAFLISELARRHVKVVLSGVGGDELFMGYPRYAGYMLLDWYARVPGWVRRHLIAGLLDSTGHDPYDSTLVYRLRKLQRAAEMARGRRYFGLVSLFTEDEKRWLYTPDLVLAVEGEDSASVLEPYLKWGDGKDPLNQIAYADVRTYLPNDLLTYSDRMSMAVSLEQRVPLCDHRLVEYALSIPSALKMPRLRLKYLMWKAVKDLLPRHGSRRRKQGFVLPIEHWLRGDLQIFAQEILLDPTTLRRPYFRRERVQQLLRVCLAGRRGSEERIWALLVLEFWNRLYLDGEGRLKKREGREICARAHHQPVLPAGSGTFSE